MTKTQLEIQAEELWQVQGLEKETDPDARFWKKYDKLVKASRKATFKPPVVIPTQVLDTISAYKQLPQRHYAKLFKREKILSRNSTMGFLILALNAGLNLSDPYKLWGTLALFGGGVVLRSLAVMIFKTGKSCSLEIQSDRLKLKTKHREKTIPFENITTFSIQGQVIKLSAEFPKKNIFNRKKVYEIPLVKAKKQPLTEDEITAIYQLLEAIVKENESKKNNE